MKRDDLKNPKIADLLKDFIEKEKREVENNDIDFFLSYDKYNDVVMVIDYKLFGTKYHLFQLRHLDIWKGELLTQDLATCDFVIIENERPKIHIDLITVRKPQFIGKGYGSLLVRCLEQYAFEHKIKLISGAFIPMPPGNNEIAEKFYKSNNFYFYKDGIDTMIGKDRKDFRLMGYEYINGIKVSENIFKKIRLFEMPLEK